MIHITRLSKSLGTWRFLALGIALFAGIRLFMSELKMYVAAGMVLGLAILIKAIYTWFTDLKDALTAAEWAGTDPE